MYSFDSRVRYSETDEAGKLTVLGIINYMQDCSTFHSEEVGVGVQVLENRRRAWMLSSWQILIDRYPELGEEIRISTWHNESRGIHGYRNFVIRSCQGESLVRAGSVWFLYDLVKGTPARVTPEDIGHMESRSRSWSFLLCPEGLRFLNNIKRESRSRFSDIIWIPTIM